MKIAMLGHKRVPSREGGIEVVVEELAVRLAAMGHQVTCYNRRGRHVSGKEFDGKRKEVFQGVVLKTVYAIDKKGLAAVTSSFFGAIAAAFGTYDVVHFHAEGPCAMVWLPKLAGKKCICTIHGLDWKRAKWGKFASAYIMMGERCAARFADEIIVLSKGTQKYFKDIYGRETVLIPNGVSRPMAVRADIIKSEFQINKDEYILFLGRLVPEKGVVCLIEAFRKIRTDKKLVIAGGSSDSDEFMGELKRLAKEDRRIIFTGFVQGKMLDELYSNAYAYVLPSDVEGMPLTLLEAMSYANCCLVSDIEECVSVVEDKALLFRKGDVEDLAEKLQMVCMRPELIEKYREGAADFICGKYNWDDMARETAAVYSGKE